MIRFLSVVILVIGCANKPHPLNPSSNTDTASFQKKVLCGADQLDTNVNEWLKTHIGDPFKKAVDDFVKSIQSHARAKFFTKGDVNCIYAKSEVGRRILSEFAADLEFKDSTKNALSFMAQAIGSAAPSAKLTKQTSLIRSTQFSKLEGEREFHWTSRIDVARLYELEKSSDLIASAMPS